MLEEELVLTNTEDWHSTVWALHSSPGISYLSFGVLTNLTWHIVSTLDKRLRDVVVVNRDNAQRDEEVDEEYHNGVNLGMHLVGEWIRHTSGERHVLIWHMHHLREDRLRDSQKHWDNPYSDGLQAGPEHCAGGLDVHGIHNSFVSKRNICEELSAHRLLCLSSRLRMVCLSTIYHCLREKNTVGSYLKSDLILCGGLWLVHTRIRVCLNLTHY